MISKSLTKLNRSMKHYNSNTQNARKNKSRKATSFNPSCNQNVKTNIGKLYQPCEETLPQEQ